MSDYLRLLRMVKPHAGRLLGSLLCTILVAALSVMLVSLSVSLMGALEGVAPAAAASAPGAGDAGGIGAPEKLTALRGDLLARLREWIPALPPLQKGGAAFVGVGLWVIGLVLLKGLFEFLSDYNMRLLGLWVTLDLREQLYDRVLRQPVPFFWSHATGSLMSRITGDVGRLQKVVSGELAELLRVGCILAGQMAWAFFLYPDMSFMLAVVLPLVTLPVVRFGHKLKNASRKSQERMAEVSAHLHETLGGVRVVKAFGAERFERQRFRGTLERMLRPDARAVKLGALTTPVIDLASALALAICLSVVGWRTASGAIDLRTLPGFILGLGYFFLAAKHLARLNNSLQQGLAAARRAFQILDLPMEPLEDASRPALAPLREHVEFRGIHFSYGKREALRGIDLSVKSGEVVALVGPSGAGKTTLVNLLPRFFDPTEGTIRIDGRDIREVNLSSLRAQIGLVSQEIVLFDDTVRRNIAYAAQSVPPGAVERAAAAACAEEFIRALPEGYETRLGEGGQRLSMGQRQRLSIARALLKDSPILILDEATSALDAESEALVRAALENLMRGRTVFVIAHRLSTVRRADRIVVLENGRIVEQGSHADLLAGGRLYRRLHELQFTDAAPAGAPAGAAGAAQARPVAG